MVIVPWLTVQLTPSSDVPLLYWAAIYGNVPAIEFLVGHGADIHCREPTNNSTPLHGACWHNKPEAVRLLLQLGAQTGVNIVLLCLQFWQM